MAKKRGQAPKKQVKKKTTNKPVVSKNKNKKKTASKKKTGLKVVLSSILVLMLVVGGAYLVYALSLSATLTEVNEASFNVSENTIKFYDKNDELIESTSLVDYVPIKDENGDYNVSEDYINGIIDTEDAKFEKHNGVDFIGMVKAVIQSLFSDADRGGSTVTMQLAKLVYMSDWETYNEEGYTKKQLHPIEYKTTQMLYALKIEDNFTKEEIMENYINTVFFGNGAGYGISNASQYYFGKTPDELSLSQAALLAGIPQSPNNYDPYVDIEAATARRDVVLGRMLEKEDITQEEYDQAISENIEDTLMSPDSEEHNTFIQYSDYIELVKAELEGEFEDVEDFNLATAAVDVYTNMDPELQLGTYEVLNTDDYVTMEQDDLQAGTVTLDSQTGAVLAVGGGRNSEEAYGLNNAFQDAHQPGSTAKPIVDYAPALEFLEWSTYHKITDEEISFDGGSEVNNWDDTYYGDLTLQKALAQSRNTTALATFRAVADEVGVSAIADFMESLGINDTNVNEAYSIGGWDTGTTPLELAGAYAAFANGGTFHEPTTIRYIDIHSSSPLYEEYGDRYDFMDKGERAMSEETAYMMSKMLNPGNGDASGVGASAASGIANESLKTGTTNWPSENDYGHASSDIRDKWVAGYTPDVTTVVWTGFDREDEQTQVLTAANHDSYNIYKSIMGFVANSSSEYLHDDVLTKPDSVEAVKLKADTWPPVESSSGKTYYFIKDSDDYNEISQKEELDAPSIKSIDVSGNTVTMKWSASSLTSSYNVTIDGKNYDTTSSKSIKIPTSALSDVAGCKTSYTLGVQATKGDVVSDTSTGTVKLSSTDFCKEDDNSDDTNTTEDDTDTTEDDSNLIDGLVDSDGDGLTDKKEETMGTDKDKADTDGDTLSDTDEYKSGTDPLNRDTDGDGLNDDTEIKKGTDPLKEDTDGDGQNDGSDSDPLTA